MSRCWPRLGEGILGEDGRSTAPASPRSSSRDRDEARLPRGACCTRSSPAEYLRWREQLAALPNPPAVCVTEVPLLYEAGGETRFDKVVVITAPRQAARAAPPGSRATSATQRLLPDAEKAKRADYAYVNTGTLEELDAWVGGVMTELKAPA